MTLGEYSQCLDMATQQLGDHTINIHLRDGTTVTNVTPNTARNTVAVFELPAHSNVGRTIWWVPLADILALEVVESK